MTAKALLDRPQWLPAGVVEVRLDINGDKLEAWCETRSGAHPSLSLSWHRFADERALAAWLVEQGFDAAEAAAAAELLLDRIHLS